MNHDDASARLHYMDHLRALAMLAGLVFHAGLAYSPMLHGFWPTADRQSSDWIDGVLWALHLMRMPLFFVVAGFFAAWVLARRGGTALLRQRIRRILVPFVLAWPIVWWALSASTDWALANVQHPSPLLGILQVWMQLPDPPRMPPSTAHLWFLYYLLLFGVLHWVVRTLELGRAGQWLLARHPAWVLLGLPVLILPALISVSAPHPAPESFLPQFWAIVFYGAFFAFGTQLHAEQAWLQRCRPLLPWLLAGCALGYAAFLWQLGGEAQAQESWPVAALEACLSVWMTIACLLAGERLLARPNAVMFFLARRSYWIYLVHLPLLFILQFLLMDYDWHWGFKYLLSVGGTLAISLLGYEVFVRHTPLRRFIG